MDLRARAGYDHDEGIEARLGPATEKTLARAVWAACELHGGARAIWR